MKKEYGWEDEKWLWTHDYLWKPIIRELNLKDSIIDVGCGNGAIARRLIAEGYSVYGVDGDREGIDIAQRALGSEERKFFCVDVTSADMPDELKRVSFDVVISTEVIEHVYSPDSMLDFISGILEKKGSKLIISTPYHGYLKNLMLSLFGKWDKHFTVLWEGGHIKFFSRRTLKKLLKNHGFEMVRFYGCGRFPFLWKSMMIVAIKR